MRKYLLFIAFALFSFPAPAQTWLWAKNGGANQTGNNNYHETVLDMATDHRGNLYVLGQTDEGVVTVDGHSPGSSNGQRNVTVASWTANGTYRWSKVIGSANGWQFQRLGLDTLGGVYISGLFSAFNNQHPFQIGADTSVVSTWKSIALIKLDTLGQYKWMRLPQADTVTLSSYQRILPFDMSVEKDGTVHWLTDLPKGAYANGQSVVDTHDVYILKYNRMGQYTGRLRPQIRLTNTSGPVGGMLFAYDSRHKKYYFHSVPGSPTGRISFNGNPYPQGFFLACYNSQGQFKWFRKNTQSFGVINSRISFDDSGNIYGCGSTYQADTFAGMRISNPSSNGHGYPLVLKVDSNGNGKWFKIGHSLNAGIGFSAHAYANGTLAVVGEYPGKVCFDSLCISNPPNSGYDIFMARLNAATGAILSLDSAKSPSGQNDFVTTMAADGRGGFYLGGELGSQLSFGTHNIAKYGGVSDWWVARYGCAGAPVAQFSFTAPATNRTATFTYNGTATGIDSVVWTFGDGQRQVVTSGFTTSLSHTYSGMGTYNVCAKVYSACGAHQVCKSVGVALGVEDISGGQSRVLTLAPNPASGRVLIGYNASVSGNVEVYDVLGRKVAAQAVDAGSGSWQLDVSDYTPGLYRVVVREGGVVVGAETLAVNR